MPRNLLQYLASGASARLVALMVVPFYVDRLGIEAFGLVGFYLLLVSSSQLIELGLGTSMARRIAQMRSHQEQARAIKELALKIGVRYGAVVAFIALIIFGPARPVLVSYLQSEALTNDIISRSVLLMGFAVTGHLTVNYFTNLLLGLEKHGLVSGFRFSQVGLLQILGALVILKNPTIEMFFLSQAVGVWFLACTSLLTISKHFSSLPDNLKTAYQKPYLGRNVAGGIALVTLLGFLFSQTDRIVLSGTISLSDFGYYSLAFSIVNALNVLVAPTFNILLPVFSQELATSQTRLFSYYQNSFRVTLALLLPAVAVLIFIPNAALYAWTNDPHLASKCAPLVQLLAIGALAQALTNSPWLVQLGAGKVKAELLAHCLLIVLTPIMLLLGVKFFTLAGAALAISLAHVLHLLWSALYVNHKFFGATPWFISGNLKYWLLPIPAAIVSIFWGLPENRYLAGALVIVSYGVPAAVGLLAALNSLHKITGNSGGANPESSS